MYIKTLNMGGEGNLQPTWNSIWSVSDFSL